MVRIRHGAGESIPELGFRPPPGGIPGIEVMTLTDLHGRIRDGGIGVPRRPTFHQLVTVSRGNLRHTIDFTAYPVSPGEWLWVRPGQVQQWGDLTTADGTLILFETDFPDPATAAMGLDDPGAPVLRQPGADGRRALADTASHMTRVFTSPGPLPIASHQAVLRHLLAILILHLAHAGPACGEPSGPGDTFLRFREAVERDFARTHRLADYARELGYSTRTLSRATQAAVGVTGKEFIDRRIILEARRLLAHGDATAAQIAGDLGFTSATNFSKYFRQRSGTTPLAFRAAIGRNLPAAGD